MEVDRNGQVGAGQRTFGDDDYTYFVDYENRVTPVLLVGVDGQVLQIPAGHAVNPDALRDGDTIHLPLERENEARREYLRQIVPSGSGQTAIVPLASDLVDRLRWQQGNIPQVSQSQQDVASMSIPEKFGQAI